MYPPALSMPVIPLGVGFLVSLAAALLLVPAVRRIALARGWVDTPDGVRKWHGRSVPNVGGLAIVGAVGLGGVAALLTSVFVEDASRALSPPPLLVVLGALAIAVVGLWDDLRDLSYRAKFTAQLSVTALAVLGGVRIEVFDAALGGGALALVVSAGLTVVWMVGMMNAVNLIDGMDGLAAGVVAIALTGLAFVHAMGGDIGALVLVVVVTGALLGFLRYNFAPASVFMGDSGSLFLGYLLAAYALRGTGHDDPVFALVIPVVVMGVPVLDLLVSIVRRRRAGAPLFQPDRDHMHHRLQARMPTHRAALALYGLGGFFALGAVTMATLSVQGAATTFVGGSLVVYGVLLAMGYAPVPAWAKSSAARRREARARQVEHARQLRGGRVANERYQPAAGPER